MDGLKAHDVDQIARTVAEDLAFVGARGILNKVQFLAMLRALYAAFPDWHYDHDAPQEFEGVISVRWRQCGTHLGTFSLPGMTPVPATGTKVAIPDQCFFYKLDHGQITEIRPDPIPGGAPRGILEQIGVVDPHL
jgi:hypothetical protein